MKPDENSKKALSLAELRENIEENGALSQGFSTKLLNHLDPWILAEAVRYVVTECPVDLKTDNITIQAMIIDKAMVVMNDEEFEEIVPYFLGTSKLVEELINFCGKLFEMKSDEIGEWKNEIYILSKSRMIKRLELKQTWVEIEIIQESDNSTYQTLTVVSDNEIFSLGIPI